MFYIKSNCVLLKTGWFKLQSFGWNLLGILVIMAWTAACCTVMFGIMKALKVLRVSKGIELAGMDAIKHGEPAYPIKSYDDGEHPHGFLKTGCKLTVAVQSSCKILNRC